MAPSSNNNKKKNKSKGGGDKGKTPTSSTTSNSNKDENNNNAGGASKLKPATAINARHILCEKESQKLAAVAALEAGARFDDVAREYSADKARQGGSLGWKARGTLDAGFERAAYGVEVSGVGRPKWVEVRSGFGWHLVMVEGRR